MVAILTPGRPILPISRKVLGNVRSGQAVPDSTLDYAISLVRALSSASAAAGRQNADSSGMGPSTSSGLGGSGGSGGAGPSTSSGLGGSGGISATAAATTAAVQDLMASETTPTKASLAASVAAAEAEAERAAMLRAGPLEDPLTTLQTPQRLSSVSPYIATPTGSDASFVQQVVRATRQWDVWEGNCQRGMALGISASHRDHAATKLPVWTSESMIFPQNLGAMCVF